ncbi:P-loop containing nucleoside triphosphate hydrolase protein [Gigaspora margarita]|uniref:P-loop containing nucleoside triphosphate hydrolase protein n=1 Tax=Gigaspora margarita TaxID=4874 RepID=A0A8H4B4X0_GIGMA|nr:P-loop containing nucleoside triphosphate hydrolase protein [Gigaspora margarita]
MTVSANAISKEDSSGIKLDPTEERILKDQINFTERKESYINLYRFATKLDWAIMFIGLMFAAASGAALPAFSVLFGIMVDYYTNFQTHTINPDEFSKEVNYFSLVYVYFAIAIFIATYISVATWVFTGERIARQIRERYLRAILRQNIAYFDKYGTCEVTTRITTDIHLIQDGISEKASLAFQNIAQFIASFIIALTISWKMTLVTGFIIPFLTIISCLMNKFSAIFMERILNFHSSAGTIAEETISTIRTAVSFSAQKKLSNLYDAYLANARKEGFKMSLLNGFALGVMLSGIDAAYALAFWFGSTLIINHELTPGQVVSVFFTLILGTFSLSNFFVDIQALSLAAGAGPKVFGIIDRVPSIDIASDTGNKPEKVMGRIQLKKINFIYPTRSDVKILNDMSLDIEPGSIVALVGSSGSGKSTILSLILRFYDPISGGVFLDGRDIKSLNLTWLRRQMSLVSQEPVLFKTTIAENVSYGLVGSIFENLSNNKKREMIENACKMANAHDFIMNLPDKYETMVGEHGILLSGGQKQRIAIARAIIKDPKILLLDEATSALDTQSEGIVQNALDKASKGRTTIVIAHRLSTIRNATKIIVINKGVIIESGTHNELMKKKGFYSKLIAIQQIQLTLKVEENLNVMNSFLKDDVTKSFTIKDENHILSNESLLSSHFNQKSDVEMALEHNDYQNTTWELFKKVSSISKPELLILYIGIIASIINGCIFPFFAIIYGNIIQALSETGDTLRHDATFWALMFLIIAVMTFFVNMIQNVTLGFSSEKLTERIRSMSFASILRQDISFFDEENHGVGVLTSHLSLDVTHINGLAGFRLGNILQVATTVFVSVIVALIVGWKLTLVCLCTVPLLVGAGSLHVKMLHGFHEKTKKAYEYSVQIACEGVDNIRMVAALTREDDLWKIYHNLLDEPMRQGFKNAFLASPTFAFANSISFLVNALAFWYGSKLFMDNEYNLQKMFTIYAAIIMGSASVGRAFAHAPDIAKARSASTTIISLLERIPIIDTWSQSGVKVRTIKGHLKFSDVHFYYPARLSFPVLRGINLEVKPGQYAALVGPSGCGKSTIISLTERFYQVTSGAITIDGLDIDKINVNNLREHIALVSQEPSLYDMTIKENLFFGCRPEQNITQNDIEKACKEANIHEFIVKLPDGYDTRVGKNGTQLSGGQKQRIAIARALIRNPEILLLDEATSALDSESEKIVQKALDAAVRGRTTLAIAHRLSTIQHADVIFVIKDGKVHEQGMHQELLKLKGIYYMMVQEQNLDG